MKTPSINQNNLTYYQCKQNFGAVTIAGSKISVDHLFKEGSGSSKKVFNLIRRAGCWDSDVETAIHRSIRGLAIMDEFDRIMGLVRKDAHSQTVIDISCGRKKETLLIKMSDGAWNEAEAQVDLRFDDVMGGALIRENELSQGFREAARVRIEGLTTIQPYNYPDKILAEKRALKELLDVEPPISQEVGFRFSDAYSILRKALGFNR